MFKKSGKVPTKLEANTVYTDKSFVRRLTLHC